MIKKVDLQALINKYYLKINESVVWSFKNNQLTVDFTTPSKDVIGKVVCNDIDFQEIDLPIFNTKKIQSLVDLCEGDLLLEVDKINTVPTKLKISNERFNTVYALADALLIPRVGNVTEPEYDIKLELTSEDIFYLVKARGAMSETANMFITTVNNLDKEPVCEVIYGEDSGHDHKITYQIRGEVNEVGIKLPFDLNKFRDILHVNKDAEEGLLEVSSKGLMKLIFKTEKVESTYFMVRKSETNF